MERVGGDEGLAAEMVEIFLAQLGHWSPRLNDELTPDDRRTLRRNAHSLKSAADTTGGCALAEAAHRLEDAALDIPLATLRELSAAISRELHPFCRELQRFQAATANDKLTVPTHRVS